MNEPIYSMNFAEQRDIVKEVEILVENARKSNNETLTFFEAAEMIKIQRLDKLIKSFNKAADKIL